MAEVMASSPTEPTQVIVHTGERPTIQVIGRADRHTVCRLSGAIRGLHAVGTRHLVVDVSQMVTCNTRVLTTLARERARFTDNGGHLTIVGVQLPEFLAALNAAAVDEVFVVYDALRQPNAFTTDTDRPIGPTRRRNDEVKPSDLATIPAVI